MWSINVIYNSLTLHSFEPLVHFVDKKRKEFINHESHEITRKEYIIE